jgi:hypothetical protein
VRKKPRPFSPTLSYRLDRAILRAEEGSRFWKFVKRILEWIIWTSPL